MAHAFDEKKLRDDLSLAVKTTDIKIRVFRLVSADSGEKYWVQWMQHGNSRPICICDCPDGKFRQPGEIFGLEGFRCKHAKDMVALVESGK